MGNVIDSFRGKYAFLSNMYSCNVYYNGYTFKSSEAAFHAQKCPTRASEFVELDPSASKKLGREVQLRDDWESVKYNIMHEIVKQKFMQNTNLKNMLLSTGDAELIEGNWWNDTYWGVCTNKKYDHVGENNLGKLLMKIREELKEGK